jgi:hypothetical protein
MKHRPHPLFTIYQWLIAFPLMLIATIITALLTIFLSPLFPQQSVIILSGTLLANLFV